MEFMLLSLFLHPVHLVKIFTFDASSDGQLSFSTLKNKTMSPLPEIFTLCSSFKETSIDGSSFFTIYGEDGKHWLSLSNWVTQKKITIWVKVSTVFKKIKLLKTFMMNFWINVCIFVDVNSGDLSISLNGEHPISFKFPELRMQRPKTLENKIFLGLSKNQVSEGQLQFIGSVANVNVFASKDAKDIVNLSENLCDQMGDIINPQTEWVNIGLVKENEEESWEICNKNQTYRVAIPAQMNWNEALQICNKLGSGNVTQCINPEDTEYTISLFEAMNTSCENIWTPFTDEGTEGQFVSAISGKFGTYLPWVLTEPDGAEEENHVAIDISSRGYLDTDSNYLFCVPCDLHVRLEFSLVGVCKDTYFGKLEKLTLKSRNKIVILFRFKIHA